METQGEESIKNMDQSEAQTKLLEIRKIAKKAKAGD